MTRIFLLLLMALATIQVDAQIENFNQIDTDGNVMQRGMGGNRAATDSTHSNKEVPKGLKEWTVDERFGDRITAQSDTLSHMFHKTIFTTGLRGEYNTTGNLGTPRINRLFVDREEAKHFIFTQPYSFFIVQPKDYHFTNTLSPITNLSYNTAGDKTNGEDSFTAKFAANVGKKWGFGFKFDYLYGRGYYSNQANSQFNYTMHGSYSGDRYEAYLLLSTNHQKNTENGGITNDLFITNPESFDDNFQTNEIPTVLQRTWNRNDNQHVFLTHRYSLGFHKKVPMTAEEIEAKKFAIQAKKEELERKQKEQARRKARKEGREFDEENWKQGTTPSGRPANATVAGQLPAQNTAQQGDRIIVKGAQAADSLLSATTQTADTAWVKNVYVPVTSFIHTFKFDNYTRIFQAYDVPEGYYANTYKMDLKYQGDSIFDQTTHFRVHNTFAISLLEGFNKWAKTGLKAFASHELRHFTLPDSVGLYKANTHSVFVGGQLIKAQGKTFHYAATAEFGILGADLGSIDIEGNADVNFKLFGDTLTLAANGFFKHQSTPFYYNRYYGRHAQWNHEDMNYQTHTRLQGLLHWAKTQTTLRVAIDEIMNYTYLAQTYDIDNNYNRIGTSVAVRQAGKPINVLTASLSQNISLGPVHWESVITFQNSTNQAALPLPKLNIYTNLFLRFKIAHVLKCDLGADATYFTKYTAPDYSAALGQFVSQENTVKTEIGNYPIVNAYANFHLKQTRFFVMFSHVNAGTGNRQSFFVPHYPLNQRIFRMGLSWTFFN